MTELTTPTEQEAKQAIYKLMEAWRTAQNKNLWTIAGVMSEISTTKGRVRFTENGYRSTFAVSVRRRALGWNPASWWCGWESVAKSHNFFGDLRYYRSGPWDLRVIAACETLTGQLAALEDNTARKLAKHWWSSET